MASSTPATPGPCSACAFRSSTTNPSPAPVATACSGCRTEEPMTPPIPHIVTPIRTLLIANRGEIARRIMRSAHAMGIICVAVYSDADADSPHVAEADLAVRLVGFSPADTYPRIDLILDAASACSAEAVHPRSGFPSESGPAGPAGDGGGLGRGGPSAGRTPPHGSQG